MNNAIKCADVEAVCGKCKQLSTTTEDVCSIVTEFCDAVGDTQNLGANISEAMPLVQSLRDSIKVAQDVLANQVLRMSGYLSTMLNDSNERINLE